MEPKVISTSESHDTAGTLVSPSFGLLLQKTAIFAMQLADNDAQVASDSAFDSTPPQSVPSGVIADELSDTNLEMVKDGVHRATELMKEFEGTGDLQFSDDAAALLESLLKEVPVNDPHRHSLLFGLSVVLCRRVEIQTSRKSTERMVDLHRALKRSVLLVRQALGYSPASMGIKVQYFHQLGHACSMWSTVFSAKWDEENVLSLLSELDAEQRAAEEDQTGDHMTGTVPAVIMASALSTAYGATHSVYYRRRGRELYRRILSSVRDSMPLETMIHVGSMSTIPEMLQQFRRLQFMTESFIPFVVQLMALLMQRLVEVPLSSVVGRRAAAVAMKAGFVDKGVEWLEQCLMIVWGQMNLRAPAPLDITRLRDTEADVDGRLERICLAFLGVCVDVDLAQNGHASVAYPERMAYRLVEEWLGLVQEARSHPSFSNLFIPGSFESLRAAARTTPVIMLNLWGSQCDALIIRNEKDYIKHNLDGLTEEVAAELQTMLRSSLHESGIRSRGDTTDGDVERKGEKRSLYGGIKDVLVFLWRKVVKPILDVLKLQPVEDGTLDPPRLTWCLTGPTSFFPLHAAGDYSTQQRGTKVYDYVASSYTPTLSILANANNTVTQGRPHTYSRSILAVSQPYTKGKPSIPKTVHEVEALIKTLREMPQNAAPPYTWLNDTAATKEAVLAGMQSSSWVHLACHAQQYPLNTSESAFLVAEGESLTLADISANASPEGGELAFLSACETASGDFDLSEEGIHLAAGMLVAGYRTVIGTAWSVRDSDAPVIAEAVYKRLLRDGQVNSMDAAVALYHATRLLREKVGQDNLIRWAPFMHFGI